MEHKQHDNILKADRDTYLLIGPSFAGKSFLLTSLLKYFLLHGYLESGIVFSPTLHNGQYNFIPEAQRFPRYIKEVLLAFVDGLREHIKNTGNMPRVFVVFDDLLGMMDERKPYMQNFLATYRQYGITLFITTQYINAITPMVKTQATIACMFRVTGKKDMVKLYEQFGSAFDDWKQFEKFMEKYFREKYRCVIWWKDSDPEIDKRYSTFKAPEMTPLMKNIQFNFDPQKKQRKQRRKEDDE
jgi:hypothetical protein